MAVCPLLLFLPFSLNLPNPLGSWDQHKLETDACTREIGESRNSRTWERSPCTGQQRGAWKPLNLGRCNCLVRA